MTIDEQLAAAIREPAGDWLDAAPSELLRELSPSLVAESGRLAAAGRTGEALAAAEAAAAAYRVLMDRQATSAFGELAGEQARADLDRARAALSELSGPEVSELGGS